MLSELNLIHYDYESKALIVFFCFVVFIFLYLFRQYFLQASLPSTLKHYNQDLKFSLDKEKDSNQILTLLFDESKFDLFEEWRDNQSQMPSPEDVMIPSLLYTTDASSDESKCEESYAISSFEDILRMQLLSQDPLEYERKNRKDKRLSPKLKLFDVEKANPILSENFEKLKEEAKLTKTCLNPVFSKLIIYDNYCMYSSNFFLLF